MSKTKNRHQPGKEAKQPARLRRIKPVRLPDPADYLSDPQAFHDAQDWAHIRNLARWQGWAS